MKSTQPVKTYNKVNPEMNSMSFSISRMEDIYSKRSGRVDEPHRHNYYTLLIVCKATGVHKIDFNSYTLGSHQVFFVAPGQVHQIIEKEQSVGFVMTFSTQFLLENSIELSFIESLNLFQNYGQNPPLLPSDTQFEVLERYALDILDIFLSTANMKLLSIGAFLKLLLIECNNICVINPFEVDTNNSGNSLLRAFKHHVELHFKQEHSTTFYAGQMHITADHLNRTVKAIMGKTAKEYIQARIITEAKRLLFFSALSSKEIGFDLGFSEPANFSAFFKKHTQLSPSHFKKSELIS